MRNLQRRARLFFNRLSVREKALLVAFIWVVLAIWVTMLSRQFRSVNQEYKLVREQLRSQQIWLDNQARIEDGLREVVTRLSSRRTLTGPEMVSRIEGYAREAGVNFELSSPRTQSGEIFNLHSLVVRLRRATMAQLLDFDAKVHAESPYLSIESVKVTSDKTNPTQLDAHFVINSLELKITQR